MGFTMGAFLNFIFWCFIIFLVFSFFGVIVSALMSFISATLPFWVVVVIILLIVSMFNKKSDDKP